MYWSVCIQSGKIVLVDESWGSNPCGVLRDESLLPVGVWRFGKPCNLLTDVNHLVKVIVIVNLAVWQVCRFPHYRLSMRGGNKKPLEHFARFI